MRRPNRPMKPIGAVLPTTEIVNYQLNMQLPIVTPEEEENGEFIQQEDQMQQDYANKRNSDGFLKIMQHITDLITPTRIVDPDLEMKRTQIIKNLKSAKPKTKRKVKSRIPQKAERQDIENLDRDTSSDEEDEEEEGFAPKCSRCSKTIPSGVSLKTITRDKKW